MNAPPVLQPHWAAPPGVASWMTTRAGGHSRGPWASLNLGASCGDDPSAVRANRAVVESWVGAPVAWPQLQHGARVLQVSPSMAGSALEPADALWTRHAGLVLAVPVADCLPVLMCALDGCAVAAVHAGWRGLAAGVLEAMLDVWQRELGLKPGQVAVWLGPCIGPRRFEIGADVRQALGAAGAPDSRFVARRRGDGSPGWLADLPGLARDRLQTCGVREVAGGHWCTVEDGARFFSHRRDGVTGRMAGLVAMRARPA